MCYANPILNARESTHGDYLEVASTIQAMKTLWRQEAGYKLLTACQCESLDMFAVKISRILHGNPNTLDTWEDIAGYANLISERLKAAYASRSTQGSDTEDQPQGLQLSP